MEITTLFVALASSGLFVSRGFTPAFLILCGLRFGDRIPLLSRFFLPPPDTMPAWLLSDVTLIALGLLAALEIISTKTDFYNGAELHRLDKYWKPISFALISYGLIPEGLHLRSDELSRAGLLENGLIVLLMAGIFVMAWQRSGLLSLFAEFDPDDDLGVQKLSSWAEEMWVFFGWIVIVLYPAAMVILLLLAFGLMALVKKHLERREEEVKVPCSDCGEIIHPSALNCPLCGAKTAAPLAIGFFGQPKNSPARNRDDHRFRLAEKKRCPVCAARLKAKKNRQTCPACGHRLFSAPEFGDLYVSRISRRVPRTLAFTFLLSLIPVVGLIPGVIFYRSQIVSPFRRHLPVGSNFAIRMLLRFLFLVMILVQAIPALGGFALPVMAILTHRAYRRGFRAELAKADAARREEG